MKFSLLKPLSTAAAALVCLAPLSSSALVDGPTAESCPQIPDPIGFAGMAAALLEDGQHILICGGANFPDAEPNAQTAEQRGAKKFSDKIGLITLAKDGTMRTEWVGSLPYGVAYASFATYGQSMIIAGGCNESGHINKVTQVNYSSDGSVTSKALPDLPVPLAYSAFARFGDRLFVFGGQEKESDTTASTKSFVLNLRDISAGWAALAPMPGPRILAGTAVRGDQIIITGGCALSPAPKGVPGALRRYLPDSVIFNPKSENWGASIIVANMPTPCAAMPSPMPIIGDKMYAFCGDPGKYYRAMLTGFAPARHPGQRRTVYAYDFKKEIWTLEGRAPIGVATAPLVTLPSEDSPAGLKTPVIIVSGETFPGVRTNTISTMKVTP